MANFTKIVSSFAKTSQNLCTCGKIFSTCLVTVEYCPHFMTVFAAEGTTQNIRLHPSPAHNLGHPLKPTTATPQGRALPHPHDKKFTQLLQVFTHCGKLCENGEKLLHFRTTSYNFREVFSSFVKVFAVSSAKHHNRYMRTNSGGGSSAISIPWSDSRLPHVGSEKWRDCRVRR